MANPVLRNKIADYLDVGSTTSSFALCGVGFNTLDENPGAQMDTKTYICETEASTTIKGYQSTFPFDTDLIADEEATLKIYEIGRNRLTGEAAMVDYVRVDLFDPAVSPEGSYAARKFKVSVEVAGNAGAGGEAIKLTGNFHAFGSPVEGTFDPTTKTFVANA